MRFFITSLLFLSVNVFAQESTETFLLKFFDDRVEVVSPKKIKEGMGIIIENHTLIDLRGNVVTGEKEILSFFNIRPGKFSTIVLNKYINKRLYVVPQSPPTQEIELVEGKKSYEIPPKK